jgi:hypothetical protein
MSIGGIEIPEIKSQLLRFRVSDLRCQEEETHRLKPETLRFGA